MLRRCLTQLSSLRRGSWIAWNAREAQTSSVVSKQETVPSAEEKTYIQLIAPRTRAALSWFYEGWPKNAVQGNKSSVVFPVLNFTREQVGTIELPGDVFNVPVRRDILHRVVRWQLAKRRQGTHKTKTRAEVRGGGRKPWRQKGTGRARQGSIRAPQWRGGGKAHGKVPRSYEHKLNKKFKRLGLKCALSAKAVENRLMIVKALEAEEHKTKLFHQKLLKLLEGAPRISVLMIDSEEEKKDGKRVRLASRNIPRVTVFMSRGTNVYDLLKHDIVVMTQGAVQDVTNFLRSPVNR